jgi:N-acetylglucosamine kinase-like BadF-type ATPase
MRTEYVVAVDGGNTKTIALVASLDGRICGTGRAGCGDIYNAAGSYSKDSPDAACANIEQAVARALQMTRAERSDLVAGVFGMAGADWPEDFDLLYREMARRGLGRIISIQNDALGVLHAGTTNNVGVSIVCGTGAATGARGPDGRVWHSSFWQADAQGSAQLSGKVLNAVVHVELGLEQPTTLTERVLAAFGMQTVEEVLHAVTGREQRALYNGQARKLTPILLDEAEAGDQVARRLVQEHGYALGTIGVAAARRVGIEGTAFPLVLAGGALRHPSSVLADAIIERIRVTSPDIVPMRSRFEPVIGVLFSALEAAGVAIDEALLERLIATIPDRDLFET